MSLRSADPMAHRIAWTVYAIAQVPLQRRLPFRSRTTLARQQARRVRATAAFAYSHVPHYREAMDRLGMRPEAFRTAADLALLPLLERSDLQRDPERFISTALPRARYFQLSTDGSTGEPVVVVHDPFALFQGAAHYQRGEAVVLQLAGRRVVLRRVLVGFSSSTVTSTRNAVRRRSVVPPGFRYRDRHLSMLDSPAANAAAMVDFAPDEVRGYGSYLGALFLHLRDAGSTAGLPRVAVFGGDEMQASVRRMVSEELGVDVLSSYGAGEAHHIGFECEAHTGLHLNEDIYPVRIVDAEGNELPDGQRGEVAISNLVNRGTVLLNYRLGDVATRLGTPCSCGRSLPLMSFPQGRTDEWITCTSGELVHGQEVRGLLIVDDANLLGFRISQEAADKFTVTVVMREGGDREAFRVGVERRFAERFGAMTQTRVEFAGELPRTSGGKVRTVVSRVGVPPA